MNLTKYIFRMIVPRCKITAGTKVTIQAGSFFFGPGCEMHGNEAVELTVGTVVNHGSITAGHDYEGRPMLAIPIRPAPEPETTTMIEITTTSIPEYNYFTTTFSTTVSLRNASSVSAESLRLILVAFFLNFLINRF